MRKLLIPLLTAIALPTAVNAELWIDMANSYEELEKGLRYIKASSIIKKGDWIFAEYKKGSPTTSYRARKPYELKINCKKGILVDDTSTPYIQNVRLGDGYWKLRFYPSAKKHRKPQLNAVYNYLCKK
tara:strand:+ start:3086 stop:3469 length:384 start_codon:yes stop_codon:yes gene_type:complete